MKTRRRSLLLFNLITLLLMGAVGLWLHIPRQPYSYNHAYDRQLIEALVHDDTKAALGLIHAGADPNTRYDPLPQIRPRSPFNQLLDQLLHRSPPLANDSQTAFMLACGSPIGPCAS